MVLYQFFFRILFCIDFWLLFGAILIPCFGGALGSPSRSFLASIFDDFLMSFQDRPKSGPRAAKSLPREAQERPRTSQECPKSGQEAPKSGKKGPKTAPRGPKGQRKDNEGRASEASGRKENEKITRAVQAKQAAEKRATI